MKKCIFRIWTVIGGLLMATAVSAQKNLSDYSIVDNCTPEAVGFEASLTPLFDKSDLTIFQLPQLQGIEEIILKANRLYVLKGFSVVSADDEQQDLKQLVLYVSTDGQQWKLVRSVQLNYSGRFACQQVSTPYNGGYSWFKMALKKTSGTTGLRIADIQLFGYPQTDDENLANSLNGTITGASKARNAANLIDNDATTMAEIPNADRQQIDNYNGERRYNGLLNAWYEYDFHQPTAISAYALGLTATANRDSRPCCWELQASNDRQQWVTLDLQHYAADMAMDYYEQRYTLGATGAHIDYADVADRLLQFCEQQLERNQNNTGIYWICDWAVDASKRNEDWGGYWWAAHAVDNYVDNYRRTGKTERLTKLTKMVNGAKARNGNTLINHFYDDMEWMALALLRACDLSASVKRQYWNQVVTLFDDIIGGWSDVDGGGLHWNKNKTGDGRYKTSCSNGPAMILAARLYQQTGEERYLEWAQRIYEYMYTHNRFPDGVIKDHATLEDHEVTFSYNQGTWVGGLLELYKITGEEHYRTTATDLLDLLLFGKWYSPKGIMNERQNYNQDDGGMFKGIFVRYLTQWLLSGRLDSERQYRYTKWLLEQARAAELSAINKTWSIINPYWTHQYNLDNDVHDTSRQQTGMMLMEAIDELRRAGLLRADYSLPNPHIGKPFRYYRLVITETQGSGTIMLGSWKLIGNTSPTSVTSPTINNSSSFDGKSYNLKGIPAGQQPTGIYIKDSKKYVTITGR